MSLFDKMPDNSALAETDAPAAKPLSAQKRHEFERRHLLTLNEDAKADWKKQQRAARGSERDAATSWSGGQAAASRGKQRAVAHAAARGVSKQQVHDPAAVAARRGELKAKVAAIKAAKAKSGATGPLQRRRGGGATASCAQGERMTFGKCKKLKPETLKRRALKTA